MSNREGARDEWFRLLREAFSAASRNSSSQRSSFGSSHVLQNTGVAACTSARSQPACFHIPSTHESIGTPA